MLSSTPSPAQSRNASGLQFLSFGTFVAKTRNAREGRNPATKEVIKIPEKTSVAFNGFGAEGYLIFLSLVGQ